MLSSPAGCLPSLVLLLPTYLCPVLCCPTAASSDASLLSRPSSLLAPPTPGLPFPSLALPLSAALPSRSCLPTSVFVSTPADTELARADARGRAPAALSARCCARRRRPARPPARTRPRARSHSHPPAAPPSRSCGSSPRRRNPPSFCYDAQAVRQQGGSRASARLEARSISAAATLISPRASRTLGSCSRPPPSRARAGRRGGPSAPSCRHINCMHG